MSYAIVRPESDPITQTFIKEAKSNRNVPNFNAPVSGSIEWCQKPLGPVKGGKRRIYIPLDLFNRLAKEGVFGTAYGKDGIFPC